MKYESQEENLEVHKHFKKKKKNFNEKRVRINFFFGKLFQIVNLGSFNLLGGGFDSLDQRYEHTARCVSNDTVVYVLPIQV